MNDNTKDELAAAGRERRKTETGKSERSEKHDLADSESARGADAFVGGALVIVSLNSPREKFWGAILAINPAGLSLRGIGLNSFDDFIHQVNAGEAPTANVVFFPMHRIERMEIDARNSEIPSLGERFEAKTGRPVSTLLGGEVSAMESQVGRGGASRGRKAT